MAGGLCLCQLSLWWPIPVGLLAETLLHNKNPRVTQPLGYLLLLDYYHYYYYHYSTTTITATITTTTTLLLLALLLLLPLLLLLLLDPPPCCLPKATVAWPYAPTKSAQALSDETTPHTGRVKRSSSSSSR